jgi:hypothetical protein
VNTFAVIKPLFKYKKVAYYSVCLNNDEHTIYDAFVKTQTTLNKNKLYHILKWLQLLGQKYGAQNRFFRNEAKFSDTSALPPIGKDRKPHYVEHGKNKDNNLRLYCFRANENVVFLYSGGLKTTQKAQNCPNVKEHFILANQLTKAIDEAFKNKDINWNENCTLINCEDNFKLYYK